MLFFSVNKCGDVDMKYTSDVGNNQSSSLQIEINSNISLHKICVMKLSDTCIDHT